jgi:hypothetical protein
MHGVNEKRVQNFRSKETLRRLVGNAERIWWDNTRGDITEQNVRIWTEFTMLQIGSMGRLVNKEMHVRIPYKVQIVFTF